MQDTADETRAQADVAEPGPSLKDSTRQVPAFEVGKYVVAVYGEDEGK